MRGREAASAQLFSYVHLEERVPADHPLRPVRALADAVLAGLNERFESLYSGLGRPSISPEMLLRATLLQAFFSVCSERMLMEQIDYTQTTKSSPPRQKHDFCSSLLAPVWPLQQPVQPVSLRVRASRPFGRGC